MAPPGRLPHDYEPNPEGARHAAVLIVLTGSPSDGFEMPLIVRSADGGPHSGQVALPGGGREPADGTIVGTALREASEEIGLAPDQVHVLGALYPLFVSVSNYSITPVVAWAPDSRAFWSRLRANRSEVQSIIRAPVHALFASRTEVDITSRGIRRRVPAYITEHTVVWGATAMILAELAEILDDCGLRSATAAQHANKSNPDIGGIFPR